MKNDTGKETKDEKESEGRWIIRSSSVVGNDEVSTSNFFFFFARIKISIFLFYVERKKMFVLTEGKEISVRRTRGKFRGRRSWISVKGTKKNSFF